MSRSERRSTALAAGLLGLLVVLAVLQYRWAGQLAEAERARLQRNVEDAATRVAADFDRELGRLLFQFVLDPRARQPAGEGLALKASLWRSTSLHPELLEAVLAYDVETGVRRLDEATGALQPARWPARLEQLGRSIEAGWHGRPPELIAPDGSALVLPAGAARPGGRGPRSLFHQAVVLLLDRGYLIHQLLPELVDQHLGRDGGEYDFAVTEIERGTVLLRSRPEAPATRPPADVSVGLFGLQRGRGPPPRSDDDDRSGSSGRRGRGRRGPARHPFERLAERAGPRWALHVTHRVGSLDAVVARTRLRNLALGGGVLALLAGSFVVLAQSTRRAHRLARQQLDFMAGISHELNTPLAAIRSSGQNLADGVVDDPIRVREYGELICREEGRLSALVTQVLDYAGVRSGRAPSREVVDVAVVVRGAVDDSEADVAAAGGSVEVDVAAQCRVAGDSAALRRALRNLVSNAMKHGGGHARVEAGVSGEEVVLRVSDRGPGVPVSERERVFEPFYRGPAAASNVPGTGLGLSLVREVAVQHGGSAAILDTDVGCAVELRLPRREAVS